jgi:DNA-binding NarL/FixJ family response regulator
MNNITSTPSASYRNHFPTSADSTLVRASNSTQAIQSECCISIVSNSHLLGEALISLLKAHPSLRSLLYYTGDADTVPNVVDPGNHLILLDSGMGQDVTIMRIRQWRSLDPSPYIVVLELKSDTDLILDCIEAGAHAYALQDASSTDIAHVIEQVYQGVFQCSPAITAKLFERLTQAKNMPQLQEKPLLTRRELDVLHYVAKEWSDREIATQLVIEVRTVKHHVHNILRKLNVRNRWDAAQLALKNCWLDLLPSQDEG